MASADDDILREAADPTTPLQRLADIAYRHPEARPAIAANPATYPDLIGWLGNLDDPSVNEALAARDGGATVAREQTADDEDPDTSADAADGDSTGGAASGKARSKPASGNSAASSGAASGTAGPRPASGDSAPGDAASGETASADAGGATVTPAGAAIGGRDDATASEAETLDARDLPAAGATETVLGQAPPSRYGQVAVDPTYVPLGGVAPGGPMPEGQPPRRAINRRAALIAGAVLGGLVLVAVAVLVTLRLAGPRATDAADDVPTADSAVVAPQTGTSPEPSVTPTQAAVREVCAAPLRATVDSVAVDGDGDLVIGLTLLADCPDGRLVDTARLQLRLTDADGLAAAAVVDLSGSPLEVGPSGATLNVRLQPGCYWMADNTAPAALSAEVTEEEASPQVSSGVTAASQTVLGESTLSDDEAEQRALDQLKRQAAADRAALEGSYDGQWVPQLSSKKVGLRVNGTTFTNQKIWYNFVEMRRQYGDVLLMWSGDWQSFRYKDFWVIVAGQSFSDPDDANAWCDARGIPVDDCYASKITDSEGPDGMSKQR